MTPAKSLDKVRSSSQNVEGAKKVAKTNSIASGTSELEYWKNKALELEEKQNKQPQSNYVSISPNDMVEVISLCNDRLNLNTKQHGQGNRYSFDYFGESKSIMLSELSQIKETQRNFARKGFFLINNPSAVRMLGLEDDYKKILNVEKIKDLLSNSPDAEKLFKSANKGQQDIITDMITNMLVAGENVDMNLVDKVSKISGTDINKRVADQRASIERNKLED